MHGLPRLGLMILSLLLGALAFSAGSSTPSAEAAPSRDETRRSPNEHTGINPWEMGAFLGNVREFVNTGAGSIRIDLPWQMVEPRPDAFDWRQLDRVADVAQMNGLSVLVTLRSISSWGTKRAVTEDEFHGASLPLDMGAWEKFLSTMAERYKGRGFAYEVENEPNANFWGGTMEDYLALLKASYAAIMRADPDAKVVSGALACHIVFDLRNANARNRQNQLFDTWQQAILATHAFNVVGVHDYYFPDYAVNGWTFGSYLTHIQDLARAAGCETCKLWITETGYVSRPQAAGTRTDPGSPEKQAEWAKRAFQQALEHGVERTYWLFLRDRPNTRYFASMGILDSQGNPRPSLTVLSR